MMTETVGLSAVINALPRPVWSLARFSPCHVPPHRLSESHRCGAVTRKEQTSLGLDRMSGTPDA